MKNERGVVLGLVIITSVIFGIAAFGILMLAMSRLRVGNVLGEGRLRAQYAAEAGLVMAMQKMWDPANCAALGSPYNLDTNNDGTNDTTVTVTVTPCPIASGVPSKLQAKVTF